MGQIDELAACVADRGYAIWPGFLTSERLHSLQAQSSALLLSGNARHYPKSTRAWDLHLHHGAFLDPLTDARLHELLDVLLGERHLLSDFSLNQVHPNQPVDDWHIDYPYNDMPAFVNGALLGLQCVLPLDRFNEETGATQLIPGTHVRPRRPQGPFDGCIIFEAEPGSLLVMAAAIWHRSGLNHSHSTRSAVLMSFVERWISPMSAPTQGLRQPVPPRLASLVGLDRPGETINGVPL